MDALVLYILPPLAITVHLLISPYTKVEESFILQATRDILRNGVPTQNVSASLTANYDHFSFPGAVPRSFVGPLLLSEFSKIPLSLFGSYANDQLFVRWTLGFLASLSLIYYIYRIRGAYGSTTARFYAAFQLTQFHLPYYASRTLPNTFALIFSITAHACFLHSSAAFPQTRRNDIKLGIYLLTFAGVVFRSELALLLACQTVLFVLSGRLSIPKALTAGLAGGFVGLVATLTIDSYFWQTVENDNPIFKTPILTEKLGLIWPELSAFWFNAVEGQASEWGESPWHHYFSNALPKLLMNPIWLLTIPTAAATGLRFGQILFPAVSFISIYSLLPHKEWRFIIYTIPQLTLLSSIGATWIWNRRSKSAFYRLLSVSVLLSIPAFTLVSACMLAISSLNYPGGIAISRVHSYLPSSGPVKVHLDVPTCMTGATRFLQESPLWNRNSPSSASHVVWDKTEDSDTLLKPEFWEGVDFALMSRPSKTIGKYELLVAVPGFKRVKLYRPGEKVYVGAVREEERVAEELGLAGEETSMGTIKRALTDGFGLRKLLGGYWVGVELEQMVFILKRDRSGPGVAKSVL